MSNDFWSTVKSIHMSCVVSKYELSEKNKVNKEIFVETSFNNTRSKITVLFIP